MLRISVNGPAGNKLQCTSAGEGEWVQTSELGGRTDVRTSREGGSWVRIRYRPYAAVACTGMGAGVKLPAVSVAENETIGLHEEKYRAYE